MTIWIQNRETKEIVISIKAPKGYKKASELFDDYITENNLDETKYKILYKNPF